MPHPERLELNMSYDAPADSLYAVFPCEESLPEFAKLELEEAGQTVFRGTVDEQIVNYTGTGSRLILSARSFAAILLDNEAVPAVYTQGLAFYELYNLHAAPYGLKGYRGIGICPGDFTVSKGMSEWEVLDTFCRYVMGVRPRVTQDLIVDATPLPGTVSTVISNTEAGALRFHSASVKRRRCGVVSKVQYKLTQEGSYFLQEVEPELLYERDINVRRLLNLAPVPTWMQAVTLQKTFADAHRGSLEVNVILPDLPITEIGACCRFADARMGEYNRLRVSDVRYIADAQGCRSRLILRPESHFEYPHADQEQE